MKAPIMRTVISALIVLIVFNFAAVAHGKGKGKTGTTAYKTPANKDDTPVVTVKTVDVPEEVVWDFMVWTD